MPTTEVVPASPPADGRPPADPQARDVSSFLEELTVVLGDRLAAGAPIRLTEVERRGEGYSWDTYLVTAVWTEEQQERAVALAVKRQPVGGITGDYDVDREVALLHATAGIGLPVPRVIAWRAGRPGDPGFFAMERMIGAIPVPSTVTGVVPDRDRRAALGRKIAQQMARLHAADPASLALPQLHAPPAGSNTGAVETATWRDVYERVVDIRIPMLDLALAWLDYRSDQVSGRVSLVHNDFRVGNLVIEPGTGTLVSVLDWETAHFSDPVADLAWFAQRTSRGRSNLACKLIPVDQFLDEYERASGWRPEPAAFTWWSVQALTKTAIGCLQALAVHRLGQRVDMRYANMAHSIYYSLGWLDDMLGRREWGY